MIQFEWTWPLFAETASYFISLHSAQALPPSCYNGIEMFKFDYKIQAYFIISSGSFMWLLQYDIVAQKCSLQNDQLIRFIM